MEFKLAEETKLFSRIDPFSEEEMAAFDGPAPYANRFFANDLGNVIRLGFCEKGPDGTITQFRSGVVLQPHVAVALYKLLGELVKPYEKLIQDAEANALAAEH